MTTVEPPPVDPTVPDPDVGPLGDPRTIEEGDDGPEQAPAPLP